MGWIQLNTLNNKSLTVDDHVIGNMVYLRVRPKILG